MAPRPRDILYQCDYCGIWTGGAFAGRYDVPMEELDAYMRRVTGHPARGRMVPTAYRLGHQRYDAGGGPNDDPDDTIMEPVSNGMCTNCVNRMLGKRRARVRRLREALGAPAPVEQEDLTGTDGGETPQTEAGDAAMLRLFAPGAPNEGNDEGAS